MCRPATRILLIGINIFVINFFSYSQGKTYCEVSIAASIPLPPFAEKDVADANSGLAKIGGQFNLKGVKMLSKQRFGLGLLLSGSLNGFDTKSMIDAYMEANTSVPLNWKKDTKGWKALSLMPGFVYSLAISGKMNLANGIFIGIAYAKSPEYTLTGTGDNGTFYKEVTFKQTSVDAFAFSTSIQSSLQIAMNDKLGFIFNVGYNLLKPTFEGVEQTSSGITVREPGGPANTSIFSSQRSFTFTQNMQTVNLSIGLVCKL